MDFSFFLRFFSRFPSVRKNHRLVFSRFIFSIVFPSVLHKKHVRFILGIFPVNYTEKKDYNIWLNLKENNGKKCLIFSRRKKSKTIRLFPFTVPQILEKGSNKKTILGWSIFRKFLKITSKITQKFNQRIFFFVRKDSIFDYKC